MSAAPVRRPVRIIAAQICSVSPVNAVGRQADRFQRALSGRRFDGATDDPRRRPGRSSAVAPNASLRQEAEPVLEGTEEDEGYREFEEDVELASSQTHDAANPGALSLANLSRLADDDADESGGCGDSMTPIELGRWTEDIARAVVTLCARSEPAMESWSVVLPLDPRRLPQSELRLSLSREGISLRFQTQSPQSHRLLSIHRQSLLAILTKQLSSQRHIDIEIA